MRKLSSVMFVAALIFTFFLVWGVTMSVTSRLAGHGGLIPVESEISTTLFTISLYIGAAVARYFSKED